jgi:hypothetical protein
MGKDMNGLLIIDLAECPLSRKLSHRKNSVVHGILEAPLSRKLSHRKNSVVHGILEAPACARKPAILF